MQKFLKGNKDWAVTQNGHVLEKLSKGQSPKALYIGCSDSRVAIEKVLNADLGDLFVHRNIANQVHLDDPSLNAVLNYAINSLEIKNIIICGHSHCGGVKAVMENNNLGELESWLSNIREIKGNNSFEELVVLNVKKQSKILASHPILKDKEIQIHQWVFYIEEGLIKEIKQS